LRFSPDGKRLAALVARAAVVWDVGNLTERVRIDREGDDLRPGMFSRDLTRLVSGSKDNRVRVWDVEKGTLLQELAGHTGKLEAVAIGEGGRWAASSSPAEKVMRVWDLEKGACVREIALDEAYAAQRIVFIKDDAQIAGGGHDVGRVRLWERESGKAVNEFPIAGRRDVWTLGLAVSPDGRTLLAGVTDKAMRMWDVSTGRPARPDPGHTQAIGSLAFVDGGRRIATAGEDGAVIRWDAATGERVGLLNGGAEADAHVAADAAGKLAAVCSQDPRLTVYDAATGKRWRTFDDRLVGMHNVAMSADGKLMAVAQIHEVVRIIDVERNEERCRFVLQPRQYAQIPLAFSPDGGRIAAGSGDPDKKYVTIFDTRSGDEVARLGVQVGESTGGAHALAWSADGAMIAVSSLRKPIELWEVATGKLRARVEGDGDAGTCVAVSPNGRYLAAGGGPDQPTVRVWDLASGALAAKFVGGHKDWLRAVAFSPDSKRVVSASADTTAIVWDVAGTVKAAEVAKLDDVKLGELWQTLGDADPALAWRAMQALCGGGERAVAFLSEKVGAAPALDQQILARLLAQLDAEAYADRERAQAALADLGGAAARPLRAALETTESDEARTRLGVLLKRLETPGTAPDALRAMRGVEALERIGTDAAREALGRIGKARAGSPVGQRAGEAAERLGHLR
jgi:WD40 repeat protein